MARRVPEKVVVALSSDLLNRHHLILLVEVLVLFSWLALQRSIVHISNQVGQWSPFAGGESKGWHSEFVVLVKEMETVLSNDYALDGGGKLTQGVLQSRFDECEESGLITDPGSCSNSHSPETSVVLG